MRTIPLFILFSLCNFLSAKEILDQVHPINKTNKTSSYPQISVDTIMNNVHITYSIKDNENIISDTVNYEDGKTEIHKYADRSLRLSIKRKDKVVLGEKMFDKSFFSSIVPQNELAKNLITFFMIRSVSDKNITFFITICKPDSDVCYSI